MCSNCCYGATGASLTAKECMSHESAFQTQGAHGQDNHEGPQSHRTSSHADTPLCKVGDSNRQNLLSFCAAP